MLPIDASRTNPFRGLPDRPVRTYGDPGHSADRRRVTSRNRRKPREAPQQGACTRCRGGRPCRRSHARHASSTGRTECRTLDCCRSHARPGPGRCRRHARRPRPARSASSASRATATCSPPSAADSPTRRAPRPTPTSTSTPRYFGARTGELDRPTSPSPPPAGPSPTPSPTRASRSSAPGCKAKVDKQGDLTRSTATPPPTCRCRTDARASAPTTPASARSA